MKKKFFYVLTCEHRRYIIEANSGKEAEKYIEKKADLSPRDNRVILDEYGDFKIVKKGRIR